MHTPLLLSILLYVAIAFCVYQSKTTGFKYRFNMVEKLLFIAATCVILYVYPKPYLGFLLSVIFFLHCFQECSPNNDTVESSESFYNIADAFRLSQKTQDPEETGEATEDATEDAEGDAEGDEKPQFTTEEQFERAQSNVFDEAANETEIRLWNDGYATQGLQQAP